MENDGVKEMLEFKSGLSEVEEDEEKVTPTKEVEDETEDKGKGETKTEDEEIEDDGEEETNGDVKKDDVKDTIDYQKLWEKSEAEKEKLLEAVTAPKTQQQAQSTEPPKNVPAAVQFLEASEIEDDDLYSLTSDKEKFVKFLNSFGNKIRLKTAEEILQTVPGIAQNVAGFTVSLNELNREFFKDNPELAPIKKLVSATADELIKDRGVNDLNGYEKILSDLPEIMKEKFDLGKIGPKTKPAKSSKQAKPTGGRRPAAKDPDEGLTQMQRDIKAALEYSKKHGGI